MPPLHLLHGQAAVLGAPAEVGDRLLDLGEAHRLGVADHRDDQAVRRRDRDRDVDIVVIDDLLALDRGVDRGHVLRGKRGRLHEEAHEAEADAVLLLEQILVAGARRHHRGHVDVVERRQHRGGVLRFLEALGDGLAQARHADALLAPFPGGGRGPGLGLRVSRLRSRRCFRLRRLGPGLRRGTLPCPSAAARTSSLVRRPSLPVPLIFDGSRWCSSTIRRTAGDRVRCGPSSSSSAAGAAGASLAPTFSPGPFGLTGVDSGSSALAAGALRRRPRSGDHRADRDSVADRDQLLAHRAGGGRVDLDRDLVGLEAGDRLVRRDRLAGLLEPLAERRLGDRFAQRRDFDVGRHASSLSVARAAALLWPSASAIKAACSAAWRLARPVAGEAAGARPA